MDISKKNNTRLLYISNQSDYLCKIDINYDGHSHVFYIGKDYDQKRLFNKKLLKNLQEREKYIRELVKTLRQFNNLNFIKIIQELEPPFRTNYRCRDVTLINTIDNKYNVAIELLEDNFSNPYEIAMRVVKTFSFDKITLKNDDELLILNNIVFTPSMGRKNKQNV